MPESFQRMTEVVESAIRDMENWIHNGRRFDLVAAHVTAEIVKAFDLDRSES